MQLVRITHRTTYRYDREIIVDPQLIRLRPLLNCRTPISGYSLTVSPEDHYLNWQLDPLGNALARIVVPNKTAKLDVNVEFLASLSPLNPFDFFLENHATSYPFYYQPEIQRELEPYYSHVDLSPATAQFVSQIDTTKRSTVDFLRRVLEQIRNTIEYTARTEPGVQTCEETLTTKTGSCRDSSWLLVEVLRSVGLAARFVSGYLVQLKSPPEVLADSVELHAWTEVYLPGAGWTGLDPTSGLFATEGHIPLACTTTPQRAAPITGRHEPCKAEFDVTLTIDRVQEQLQDKNESPEYKVESQI